MQLVRWFVTSFVAIVLLGLAQSETVQAGVEQPHSELHCFSPNLDDQNVDDNGDIIAVSHTSVGMVFVDTQISTASHNFASPTLASFHARAPPYTI
ncbi:hypothetical protein [Pseudoalteromonas xiamenensis]